MNGRYLVALASVALVTALAFAGFTLAGSVESVRAGGGDLRFDEDLEGEQEVPPVDTETEGRVKIRFNEEETEAEFRLIVRDGVAVTVAHIHCGAEGVIGPPVVFLFGPVAGGVDVDGELARGTFDGADVVAVPNSAQCPGGIADLDDLIAKMRSGDTYVNAHTVENPGGEIRGQLEAEEQEEMEEEEEEEEEE